MQIFDPRIQPFYSFSYSLALSSFLILSYYFFSVCYESEVLTAETMKCLHPWRWIVLKKPTVVQPHKKFPAFYRTRRFITVFINARHWRVFWAIWIHSKTLHPISLRSILILSSHLCLCLHNKSCKHFSSSMCTTHEQYYNLEYDAM
jgi:hypothetical protein